MPGRFVIRRGRTGKFHFVLVSSNGKVIATSDVYESKAACRNGIRAVQRLAADAGVEDESPLQPSGLRGAAAPVKDAAQKAKSAVERAAKKLPPLPPPAKDAAQKAKSAVEGAAKKLQPLAEKPKRAVEKTLRKAKEGPTGRRPRTTGP